MYWDDMLTTTGAHQEALELTSWLKPLCQRLELATNLEISVNLIFIGYHISGIELDTCWPHQDIRQEGDQWLSIVEGFTAQQSPSAVLMDT